MVKLLNRRSGTIYLGVDPGWSGALAGLSEQHGLFLVSPFKDLTEQEIYCTFRGAAVLARDHGLTIHAGLEQVHAMPKQGVSSTFKFGRCYGLLEMALVANSIPYTMVTPQKWQRALGCLSRGDKNVTKRRAQQLYPEWHKITHATADAILIARWAMMTGLHRGG